MGGICNTDCHVAELGNSFVYVLLLSWLRGVLFYHFLVQILSQLLVLYFKLLECPVQWIIGFIVSTPVLLQCDTSYRVVSTATITVSTPVLLQCDTSYRVVSTATITFYIYTE